jgi:hypothetical protein
MNPLRVKSLFMRRAFSPGTVLAIPWDFAAAIGSPPAIFNAPSGTRRDRRTGLALLDELSTGQAREQFRDVARTACEHGLTAILFAGASDKLDLQPPENIARLKQARSICERYHLGLVPSMFDTGYGAGIRAHD